MGSQEISEINHQYDHHKIVKSLHPYNQGEQNTKKSITAMKQLSTKTNRIRNDNIFHKLGQNIVNDQQYTRG